jgi:hypothetical protein
MPDDAAAPHPRPRSPRTQPALIDIEHAKLVEALAARIATKLHEQFETWPEMIAGARARAGAAAPKDERPCCQGRPWSRHNAHDGLRGSSTRGGQLIVARSDRLVTSPSPGRLRTRAAFGITIARPVHAGGRGCRVAVSRDAGCIRSPGRPPGTRTNDTRPTFRVLSDRATCEIPVCNGVPKSRIVLHVVRWRTVGAFRALFIRLWIPSSGRDRRTTKTANLQGFLDAGGGTRTPDTRIMIPPDLGLASIHRSCPVIGSG